MPESREAKTVLPLSCILQHRKNVLPESFRKIRHRKILGEHKNVLSESFMHLPLRPIFRQSHPNFINVRTAYASKIWAQLTKNLLAKSSTKRFREYILVSFYMIPLYCTSIFTVLQALLKKYPADSFACRLRWLFSHTAVYRIF